MKLLFTLILTYLAGTAFAAAEPVDPFSVYAPVLDGDTLVFEGRIDIHFLDYLDEETDIVKEAKYLSLNSSFGRYDLAIEIAEKIQSLGLTSVIRNGNACEGPCAYLFASAKDRVMEKGTRLVVKSPHIKGSYAMDFTKVCFDVADDGLLIFDEKKKGCGKFLTNWYEPAQQISDRAFDVMEKSGVSAEARKFYFGLPDDPKWPQNLNVLRKPDWIVDTSTALQYGFATEIR